MLTSASDAGSDSGNLTFLERLLASGFAKCCAVTLNPQGQRQRCREPLDHRGPHWRNAQLITCGPTQCVTFCTVPDHGVGDAA